MSIERTEWFQEGLDDPQQPSNQGSPFKRRGIDMFGEVYDPAMLRPERKLVYPGEPANLVSSLTRSGKHAPVLDLDIPARLVPSKTPGHSHLYIDVELSWQQYAALLNSLAWAGIIEPNYASAAQAAQATFVRKYPDQRPERGQGYEGY